MYRYLVIILVLLSFKTFGQMNDSPTEILILGTLHFNQFHDANSEKRNFLSEQRQKEFLEVINKLSEFHPEAIFVEREPNQQSRIDSLFNLKNFDAKDLSDGLSEVYQIGFELAKKNKLNTIYGIDYYESIPQDLFEKGKNIEIFQDSLKAFQTKGRGITMQFLNGNMSINNFLIELNKEENIKMSHRLFFNTPAYVTEGSFKNENDYANVDNNYIGAKYISLFYERNLKIYSNILNINRKLKAKKIILIIGQVHAGVLKEIIDNNPLFKIIEANQFLRK